MKSTYLLIGTISLVVITTFIYGITVVGSPFETRARKFDEIRIRDISDLKYIIQDYYSINRKLPDSLGDLKNIYRLRDPETKESYSYIKTGKTTYELCAVFNMSSSKNTKSSNYYNDNFEHPKGNHCFNFEIENL